MIKYERTDKILEILNQCKYTTVDHLVKELHYSPATIRRDLTHLENIGLVKKSYGGVCINDATRPVSVRKHQNTEEKIKMCREAAELISDRTSIFIDGSTTTCFMRSFLDSPKDLVVTTSNLKLAIDLEAMGIECYTTGGRVVDTNMLAGVYAVDTVSKMNFDMCFFSAESISKDGNICDRGELFADLRRMVIKRSKKAVCLCDSNKLGSTSFLCLASLGDVDYVISGGTFSPEWKEQFPGTKFITV